MKAQTGTTLKADFEENTWTFEMKGDFQIKSGEFVIIEKDLFDNYQSEVRNLMLSFRDKLTSKNINDTDEKMLLNLDKYLSEIYNK